MKSKCSKRIKVALVAPSMKNIGGQSIQAQRLIEAFVGNETVSITLIPNNPCLEAFSFLQRLKFIRTLATSLKFWWTLVRQIPGFDFVQVYSSGTTSYIISTLPPLVVSKIFGKKTILNYHHGGLEEHITRWKLTAKPTMKLFDKIIVPSQFLVDVFAKFGLNARAVYNFVDTEKFVFRSRNPLRPVFLSNRNFEPNYKVSDVLRAFHLIQQKICEAKLIVAGYGSEETNLKKLAAELNLKKTEFIGKVEQSEMPKIYDLADVFLNSSIVDNMPLSIIEAFACGLPVVSTDAGGISYIIENEKNGLLVETNDYESLANKAIGVLGNKDLAQKIINNARRECVKYACENIRGEWLAVYQK